MCGIIGAVGDRDTIPLLLQGLKRLEYRGYDSAGIGTLVGGKIECRRAEGKLVNLEKLLNVNPLSGSVGIGHTRWATHGIPNEANAHPQGTEHVAVVHNGIIENFRQLREELVAAGRVFSSETDTEVIAQLVSRYMEDGHSHEGAVGHALKRLEGAFALGFIFTDANDVIIGARRGSPLAVGRGEGEMYIGSDALALAPLTQTITYIEDGDWAVLTPSGAELRDLNGRSVERPITSTSVSGEVVGKGGHRHYMKKEIFEQPTVIGETLKKYCHLSDRSIQLPELSFDPATLTRFTIVACGTSYYAAAVAKYWFEKIARLPIEIDISSEFRYRASPLSENGAFMFISQSGETADTLAALRFAVQGAQPTLALINVAESTMAREAETVLRTHAGPEIGVASTKAFTCQLVTLACLAIAFAQARGSIDQVEVERLIGTLTEIPTLATNLMHHEEMLKSLAPWLAEAKTVVYFGRGTFFPIALEGALKLKEISYIHAEGFAAGELKHGPIALIDNTVPVIVLAPSGELFDKTASNVREVVARGGRVVLMSDEAGVDAVGPEVAETVTLPTVDAFAAPILYAISVQLLAYFVAVQMGTDVDQPRNLAKSVTVE